MQLVAADRTVPADLRFEVDLLVAVVGAEKDEVTRALERVETSQLLRQNVRFVKSGEKLGGL